MLERDLDLGDVRRGVGLGGEALQFHSCARGFARRVLQYLDLIALSGAQVAYFRVPRREILP